MPRSRSRSRSYSGGRRRRSPSPYRSRRSPSPKRRSRRSPSPKRGGRGGKALPPSKCLGIFGMSDRTSEKDVNRLFGGYPGFLNVRLIKDNVTNRTRGFGFMNFETIEDASDVRDKCNGMEIDGRVVTVEYSHSSRAVTPTPGIYCGARERDIGYRTAPRHRSRSRSRSRSGRRR